MAAESDKLNTGAVATLVAVLALTMVAIIAVLITMVRTEVKAEVERKGGPVLTREYRDLAAAQRAELTDDPKWTDRKAGTLSIPIDRAMTRVVEELRSNPDLATAVAADAGVPDATTAGGEGGAAAVAAPPPSPDPAGAPN